MKYTISKYLLPVSLLLLLTACSSEKEDSTSDEPLDEVKEATALVEVADYSEFIATLHPVLQELINDRLTILGVTPEYKKGLFDLGRAFHANRQYDAARAYYMQLLGTDSPEGEAKVKYYLADLARFAGDQVEMRQLLEEVTTLQPTYAPAHLKLGELLYKNGDVAAAMVCYNTVLALDPTSPFANLAVARKLLDDGDKTKAITVLRETVVVSPQFSEALVLLAKLLDEQDESEEADALRAQNENWWDLPPQDPWLDELIVFIYDIPSLSFIVEDFKRVGDVDRALVYLEQMEMANPLDYTPHVIRGNLFYDNERREEAERQYLIAIGKGAPPEKAHMQLVKILIEMWKPNEAEMLAKEAISINPNIPLLYVMLGGLYVQRGDFEGVKENFNKALELDPTDPFVSGVLGDMYLKDDEFENAAKRFEAVAQLSPQDLGARVKLVILYMRLNKPLKSLEMLDEIKSIDSANTDIELLQPAVYERCAELYMKESSFALAIQYYSKVIEVDPKAIGAYEGKAQAHFQLGQLTEAENTLQLLILHYPEDPNFHLDLGDIQNAGGRILEARQNWKKAQELLTSDHPESLRQKLESRLNVR